MRCDIVVPLLACGLMRLRENDWKHVPVRQTDMPEELRRGLALLSAQCLSEGKPDKGGSVHEFMALATTPLKDWGLAAFAGEYDFADAILVDREMGVPTEDCGEIARGPEIELIQNIHHENLREAVRSLRPKVQDSAYTKVREFVVRNPVVKVRDLKAFCTDSDIAPVSQFVEGFYRRIPTLAQRADGSVFLCAHCKGVLWEKQDKAAFPDGRCHIKQCDEEHNPERGEVIDDPFSYRVADRTVLAYWVGPGLDEIRILDTLKEHEIDAKLYPKQDAADVGVKLNIGIDAKSFTSPVALARKLSKGVGKLAWFKRKIIAVSDAKVRKNPDYLKQLNDQYEGQVSLEFMTVSKAIETVVSEANNEATA